MSAILKRRPLPQIWLKASMLGSLWASVEIVLGSFLHNLHVPFSGTFLAALGVIVMINGYKLWPESGLFWRTALVTALMKSMSPSAIILGPMVGIFMEGVILEISTRVFRKQWIGFIIGGAFAVSWSLFQKIFVLLFTYGPDFILLYEQLYFMAQRTLGIEKTVPIDLVKLIFAADLSFGALVAAMAWNTSSSREHQRQHLERSTENATSGNYLTASVRQSYSVVLIVLNLMVLIAGLSLLDRVSPLPAFLMVLVYVTVCILRYGQSLKRLKRPQLWIQLVVIMSLSGLLLGGWQSLAAIQQGLVIGLSMATRALLVIFCFAALSIELRNPTIIDWFKKQGMGVIFESVSLAFEVLPHMMKMVSQLKQKWRHPFKVLLQLLASLEVLRVQHSEATAEVLFITGDQGAGKTDLIQLYLDSQWASALDIQGILTFGTWIDGERDHYHVRDIQSGRQALLCERKPPLSEVQAGPFNFRDEGFKLGNAALSRAAVGSPDLVIIDEVGHLECYNKGWATSMDSLVKSGLPMIWSVRPSLLDTIASKWPINYRLFTASNGNLEVLDKCIRDLISRSRNLPAK